MVHNGTANSNSLLVFCVFILLPPQCNRYFITHEDNRGKKFEEFQVLVDNVREPEDITSEGETHKAINTPLLVPQHTDQGNNDINFEEFQALLDSTDIHVIDVRESDEIIFDGEIPNVINIPLGEISTALTWPPHKFQALYSVDISEPGNAALVFSCKAGIRSNEALQIALELGFTKARQYGGGYDEWSERMK